MGPALGACASGEARLGGVRDPARRRKAIARYVRLLMCSNVLHSAPQGLAGTLKTCVFCAPIARPDAPIRDDTTTIALAGQQKPVVALLLVVWDVGDGLHQAAKA